MKWTGKKSNRKKCKKQQKYGLMSSAPFVSRALGLAGSVYKYVVSLNRKAYTLKCVETLDPYIWSNIWVAL